MPHSMIVLIPYINLLTLSWTIKCLFLRDMEPLMKSEFNDAFAVLFYDFLYKNVCCGYSFELPQLVEAIQRSSHNMFL